MKAIIAIARNTFKEAIRDRILYMFLGFAIVLIVSSKFISMLTIGDSSKIIKDMGLAALQLFGMLIAVMMSVLMISREMEQKSIYTILTKPVNRFQYLLGKYFGLISITFAMLALMTVCLVLIVFLYNFELEFNLLLGAFFTLLEMLLLCAFAILFSVITKPILGSVLTLSSFFLGHLTGGLLLLLERMKDSVSQTIIPVLYHTLPNLEIFNFKTEIVHDLAIPWDAAMLAVAYCFVYTTLILIFAWFMFANKDIE